MDKTSQSALAENLIKLMDHHGYSQVKLAKKAGIAQTTVSNLIRPDSRVSPTMESIDKIAVVFRLKSWKLLMPGISLDILINRTVETLIHYYKESSDEGRDNTLRVAENEARYATIHTEKKEAM